MHKISLKIVIPPKRMKASSQTHQWWKWKKMNKNIQYFNTRHTFHVHSQARKWVYHKENHLKMITNVNSLHVNTDVWGIYKKREKRKECEHEHLTNIFKWESRTQTNVRQQNSHFSSATWKYSLSSHTLLHTLLADMSAPYWRSMSTHSTDPFSDALWRGVCGKWKKCVLECEHTRTRHFFHSFIKCSVIYGGRMYPMKN